MVSPGALAFQVTSQTPAVRAWFAASHLRQAARVSGWTRSPSSMPLVILGRLLGRLPAGRCLALLHLRLQLVQVEAVLAARRDEGGLDQPAGDPVRERARGDPDGLGRLSGGQQSVGHGLHHTSWSALDHLSCLQINTPALFALFADSNTLTPTRTCAGPVRSAPSPATLRRSAAPGFP